MKASLTFRKAAATAIILVVSSAGLAGQDSLSAARDLYAGAAYEDALLLLNRLRFTSPPDEASAIEQYRAFCLLALGRSADAEQAIAAVVQAQPLFQPSNADVSPRLRSAFSDVRRRVLPAVVQERYAASKSAYDRKSWAEAERGFKQVLDLLNDPELAGAATQSPLADIKTLAVGFYDLSVVAAAPPPPPPPPVEAPPPPPPPVVAVAGPPRIYVAGEPGVVPPVALKQSLPAFPTQNVGGPLPKDGSIEIVINESGAVESALMKVPMSAAYDRQALIAARGWEYKPATLNGVAVKFRKTVQINVKR
jgi:outer membrane biosynthesis protein TonB